MDSYIFEKKVGSGSFGWVYKARHRDTGVSVAIKEMMQPYDTWDECLQLREVQTLCALRHPALVQLFAIVREGTSLFLIFEFVGPNLYQAMKNRTRPLPEPQIRSWLRQILQGLAHMHAAGYVHRDIKPENLLLNGSTLKIADFGLVRSIKCGSSVDENGRPWTEYVSTRWYRAPEVILRSTICSTAMDIYAVGAVAAELYSLQPLFPGTSEIDQLMCICSVLGPPTLYSWPEGLQLAARLNLQFPEGLPPMSLRDAIPEANSVALDLISKMCAWDPQKRITAEHALQHPYFASAAPRPLLSPLQVAVVREQLKEAAEKVGNAPEPVLTRLMRRTAKRHKSTLKFQKRKNNNNNNSC